LDSQSIASPGDGTVGASDPTIRPIDDLDDGTLRGVPNKPLPPTPLDQSPASEHHDGTLVAASKRVRSAGCCVY
jgi:hypothetical protein